MSTLDETRVNREQGTRAQGFEPALLVNGQADNRRPHYADKLWRSDAWMRDHGVNPATHELALRRDPAYWNEHEASDRLEEAMDSEEGLQPVYNKNGAFAKCGDLVYCMKPKHNDQELLELSDRAIDAFGEAINSRSSKSFQDSMNMRNKSISRWDSNDPDLDRRARLSADQNRADGIIGQTSQIDYNRAISTEEGRNELRRIQARFLNPGSRRTRIAEGAEGDRQIRNMNAAARRAEDFTSGTSFPHGAVPAKIGIKRPSGFKEAADATRARKG